MVEPEAVTTLLRLRALGWGSKRIARELGISRGTVKRYIEAGGWLRERFRRHRGNADVVRQELAAEEGIVASLRTVQRAVEPYRQELLAEARATVRLETAAGRRLQIDFGRHPERQAARGPRGRGWSRSPGARSRSSCSSRRSAIRADCTCGRFATSVRRAGSTAWRALS